MKIQDLFSDMYLCYYEGDFLRVPSLWGQKDRKQLYCKIYYIVDGECAITIEGKEYIGRKGDFFFIPDGALHSFRLISDDRVKKYYFHFYMEINGQKINQLINLPCFMHLGLNDEVKEICESILQSARNKSLGSSLELRSNLLRLIAFYVSLNESQSVLDIPDTSKELDAAEKYINRHLGEKLTLPLLAGIAKVHPNYLCRLFKARYGVPPMRYVYEKRMDYSRYLLLYTQISVSDIAAMVGYNDISHFSKEFKKYSLVSPRYFRNRTHTDRQSPYFGVRI